MVPESEVVAELQEWDRESFKERIERWIFLREKADPPPEGWALPSSFVGGMAWWEAGRCFVGGNFIATVVLIQSSVEDSVRSVLQRTGKANPKRMGFKELIDVAQQIGEIGSDLAVRLHRLRELRNPYVHADVKRWPPAHIERSWNETNGDFYAVCESDARMAIDVGGEFIRYIAGRWDPLAKDAAFKSD